MCQCGPVTLEDTSEVFFVEASLVVWLFVVLDQGSIITDKARNEGTDFPVMQPTSLYVLTKYTGVKHVDQEPNTNQIYCVVLKVRFSSES